MVKLYWYFQECWILRGFRGILSGVKYKFFPRQIRRVFSDPESWDFI